MTRPYITTSLVNVTDTVYHELPYRAFYKNELEQPSGLFKLRGIGHCIQQEISKQKGADVRVYTSSGGNAGLAAAYASKELNVPCTVVLPTISKQLVIDKLKALDAEVIVKGRHWGEADNFLQKELIGLEGYPSSGAVYVHPFDNADVWEGHSSMIDEIVEQLGEKELTNVRAVVCSVGGGGLFNGIVQGLNKYPELKNVPVIAVETTEVPCFRDAVEKGEVVHLSGFTTLATSLGSPYVSAQSLEHSRTHKTYNHVIEENDALEGVVEYFDKFGSIVEPACGATISLTNKTETLNKLLQQPLQKDDIIVYIVCGGKATDEKLLQEYREILAST